MAKSTLAGDGQGFFVHAKVCGFVLKIAGFPCGCIEIVRMEGRFFVKVSRDFTDPLTARPVKKGTGSWGSLLT
jgi:hypothetical protein